MRRLARRRLLADALAVDGIVDAVVAENAGELTDVGEARQVFQRQHLIGEERGDHQRQRGVFRARNRDDAVESGPAADLNAIHYLFPPTPKMTASNALSPPRDACRHAFGSGDAGPSSRAGGAAGASVARERCCALRRFRFSLSEAERRSRRFSRIVLPTSSGLILVPLKTRSRPRSPPGA